MNLPFSPMSYGFSKNLYDRGYAINWIHQPKMIHVELQLDYNESQDRSCCECQREITIGEIYGKEDPHFINFKVTSCTDCMTGIPSDIEAWKFLVKMKRRSSKNPDGIYRIIQVSTRAQLETYMEEIMERYPGSTCEILIASQATAEPADVEIKTSSS